MTAIRHFNFNNYIPRAHAWYEAHPKNDILRAHTADVIAAVLTTIWAHFGPSLRH